MTAEADPVRIQPIEDARLIEATITHPRVWAWVHEDNQPDPTKFRAVVAAPFLYLGVWRGMAFLGLFMVHQVSAIMAEVHTCLLPAAWGQTAIESTRAAMAWVWRNTGLQRLITSVPEDNPLALRLALRSGMTAWGCNPSSFLKGDRLLSQTMLGISRPAEA